MEDLCKNTFLFKYIFVYLFYLKKKCLPRTELLPYPGQIVPQRSVLPTLCLCRHDQISQGGSVNQGGQN